MAQSHLALSDESGSVLVCVIRLRPFSVCVVVLFHLAFSGDSLVSFRRVGCAPYLTQSFIFTIPAAFSSDSRTRLPGMVTLEYCFLGLTCTLM